MKIVALGDVCKKGSSGIAQKDIADNCGDFPIYGAGGLIKYVDFYHQEHEYIAIVKDGAGIGRAMLLPPKSSIIGTMQYIIPNDDVDVRYLYYAIVHMNLAKYYTGTTIPHIYFKDYRNEKLLLPELPRQHEIANLFAKIDQCQKKMRQQLTLVDDLARSRFIEMFGDPVRNDKSFDTKLGDAVFKISNGIFVPENRRKEQGVPVYGGNGISWYTDEILYEMDTIAIGRVGFQSGNVHFARGPLWISDNAMYISELYDDGFDLRFLYYVMEHINFTRFQDAGDLKKVTQKPFMRMQYIKPPLLMQKDYITFVEATDKSKLAIQESLNKLAILKKSLMQQYFGS